MEFYFAEESGVTKEVWDDMIQKDPRMLDFIGSIRCGNVCFDMMVRYDDGFYAVDFDLYVGGIDDGYGYSACAAMATGKYKNKEDVPASELYPYTEVGTCYFCKWYDLVEMSYETFVQRASEALEEFICGMPGWVIRKANEPLKIW